VQLCRIRSAHICDYVTTIYMDVLPCSQVEVSRPFRTNVPTSSLGSKNKLRNKQAVTKQPSCFFLGLFLDPENEESGLHGVTSQKTLSFTYSNVSTVGTCRINLSVGSSQRTDNHEKVKQKKVFLLKISTLGGGGGGCQFPFEWLTRSRGQQAGDTLGWNVAET
jgi:hypothetical protein